MKVDLNPDFEEAFPDEVYAGFTLKQCVVAVVGLILAAGCAVSLWYFFGMDIVECTYIAIPIMIPVCALGFYQYQKQTPDKMLKEIWYSWKTKRLMYEAEEFPKEKQRIHCMKRGKDER